MKRFNYECAIYQNEHIQLPVPKENTCSSNKLQIENGTHIVLEEYAYEVEVDEKTKQLAETLEAILFSNQNEGYLKDRLVVLTDDDFTDFVKLRRK